MQPTINGEITFENVSFKDPSNQNQVLLQGFSQVFEANKSTALFGEADAGSSTIITLIERFYEPHDGDILIDGQHIVDFDVRSMRRLIGYVGRDPSLFRASIRENLRFARPDATDEQMEAVLKDLGAWDFLKHGLDTNVGDPSNRFSGGQLQQLAVARAFIKKPKILLLDEATSAMDKSGVEALLDMISKYRTSEGSLTVVIVAFRIVTFKTMDKIVILQKGGGVGAVGTHEEIMSDHPDGVYAKYCK